MTDITEIPTHELIGDRAAAQSDKRIASKLMRSCHGITERITLTARILSNERAIAAIDAELARRGE